MKSLRGFAPLIILILLILPNSGFAQDGAKQKLKALSLTSALPIDPDITTGKLENGIIYFIKKNKKPEKRAELRLAVNAGSVLENDDQKGLAHFVEHMAFNGTKNFKKNDIVTYMESIGMRFGGDVNAYTGFDETVYMLQVPTDRPDAVEKGLQILEDWACNVSFDNEEIDKERGVIIEEWRVRKDASSRIMDKQYPILFKNSKYAERLPIGDVDILKTFKYETLKKFYKDWYRPDLVAVIAVGDFDVKGMEEQIRNHFSRIPAAKNPVARPAVPVPDHNEMLFAIATDPEATGTDLSLYYKHEAKPLNRLMDYRRSIVEDLYDDMFNDRLQELIRQSNPPFLSGYGTYRRIARRKDGYVLRISVKNDGVERGLEAVLTEAMRVKKHGFTETELERAKTDLLRSMETMYNEREKTNSANYASEYIRHFLTDEPIPGLEMEYEIYKKYIPSITLEEVNKLASEYITDRSRVLSLGIPEKKDVKVPTESELTAVIARVEKKEIEPYVDKVSKKPLVEGVVSRAKVKDAKKIDELGVTEWTMSNGIRVVLKPTDFKNDEILFTALSPGGHSLVSDKEYLSGAMASSVLQLCGVGEFDVMELKKMLTGKVVSVSPMIGELQEGFSGSAAPQDLETMFQLIYLYFTAPRKDTAAFQSFKSRMKGYLENFGAMPERVFQDTVSVTLSQYHPRRKPMTAERLDEIDLDVAYRIYQDRFVDAGDFTFLFVGNFEPEKIKSLVETYLGALPVSKRKESWKDPGVTPPKGLISKTVVKGIDPKSMVLISFTDPFDWTYENRYYLTALNEIMTMKMREEVREEKGGTYGVGVRASATRLPRSQYNVIVSFGCNPERVEELTKTVFDVMNNIIKNGASDEDIAKVKEIQRREREKRMKENGFWIGQLQSSYTNGDDPKEFLRYEKMIDGLTSEDIKKTAAKYLKMDNYARFVLMPEEKK